MSTPSYMIYGELGRYPMDIDIKVRIISYWTRLITGSQNSKMLVYEKQRYITSISCLKNNKISHIIIKFFNK